MFAMRPEMDTVKTGYCKPKNASKLGNQTTADGRKEKIGVYIAHTAERAAP